MIHFNNWLLSVSILIVAFLSSCSSSNAKNLLLIDGQYPIDSAIIFSPNIVSTDSYEFAITFNPTMTELYFTRRESESENEIYSMKLINGEWTKPELSFFSSEDGWDFEPHIDPTGKRLYFGSTRPLSDSIKSTGLHQWYCEKLGDTWSSPTPLEGPFINRPITMFLTSTSSGNLYFTSGENGDNPEDWVIYKSEDANNEVTRLGDEINIFGKWIAHPFIAPDESYMIYDFRSDSGYGESDLYISFNLNGSWSTPKNLGPKVNTYNTEMCASVSPDGNYLFFHRGDDETGDIFWIYFKSIKDDLKPVFN